MLEVVTQHGGEILGRVLLTINPFVRKKAGSSSPHHFFFDKTFVGMAMQKVLAQISLHASELENAHHRFWKSKMSGVLILRGTFFWVRVPPVDWSQFQAEKAT